MKKKALLVSTLLGTAGLSVSAVSNASCEVISEAEIIAAQQAWDEGIVAWHRLLLRAPLCLVGAWPEQKYQRPHLSVLSQGLRLCQDP